MNNKKCTLSDTELINKSEEIISDLCKTKGNSWTLSVPADYDKDPDLIFAELTNRFHEIIKIFALLKEALKDYRNGDLKELSLIIIFGTLIEDQNLTDEDIEWAKEVVRTMSGAGDIQYDKK